MKRRVVSVIFGTRPEAIKLAPVILEWRKSPDVECRVCVTAQHRQMLDQVLETFGIVPDVDLNLMRDRQSLASLTAAAVEGIDRYLARERPDLVLVQGDTTTVFCAALAALYNHIPVGHVEAGLRTGNLNAPWPEEANRVLTSRLCALHFAPTEESRRNLVREGIDPARIHVSGNTVVDALFLALSAVRRAPPVVAELPDFLQPANSGGEPRMVLITGHRRENFGRGMENICRAILELARAFPDVHFVYPVHLNQSVREPVARFLGTAGAADGRLPNVHLLPPLAYLPFVALMNRASLILTDSGGIQEEAPSLGKPVLVMRDVTERPEALVTGAVRLVGTETASIVEHTTRLLVDRGEYERMAGAGNPFGDGHAAGRIVATVQSFLSAHE